MFFSCCGCGLFFFFNRKNTELLGWVGRSRADHVSSQHKETIRTSKPGGERFNLLPLAAFDQLGQAMKALICSSPCLKTIHGIQERR